MLATKNARRLNLFLFSRIIILNTCSFKIENRAMHLTQVGSTHGASPTDRAVSVVAAAPTAPTAAQGRQVSMPLNGGDLLR